MLGLLFGKNRPPRPARRGLDGIRERVAGLSRETPLLGGGGRVYINLDNAATTPPFCETLETVNRFAEWHASIHRGAGYKSRLSTAVYEECRGIVARFVGADPIRHTAVFCGNTTDAINKLCRRLALAPGELVLATEMDHHSNLLPWRLAGRVDHVRAGGPDGALDLEDLERKLKEHGGRVRLVALTGASNVTGYLTPLRQAARLAHRHGARLLVDAAQLIAHRAIEMGSPDEPEGIDFLAFSAHKIYAPFGSGVLIGPRDFFADGPPSASGGGTVRMVTLDDVVWAGPPENEEAGTPNILGAVALAKSLQILEGIGMDAVAAHERDLTGYLLRRLNRIAGLRLFGDRDEHLTRDRVGVAPFLMAGLDHALVAAALGYEHGIGVRNGCFCAHPYLLRLLDLGAEEIGQNLARVRQGDQRGMPGFVRVSLGLYNTRDEIDTLAGALEQLAAEGPRGRYRLDRSGEFHPEAGAFDFRESFKL